MKEAKRYTFEVANRDNQQVFNVTIVDTSYVNTVIQLLGEYPESRYFYGCVKGVY